MAKSGTNGSGKGQFGRIRPENGTAGQTGSVRTGFGTQNGHFMQQQVFFGRFWDPKPVRMAPGGPGIPFSGLNTPNGLILASFGQFSAFQTVM